MPRMAFVFFSFINFLLPYILLKISDNFKQLCYLWNMDVVILISSIFYGNIVQTSAIHIHSINVKVLQILKIVHFSQLLSEIDLARVCVKNFMTTIQLISYVCLSVMPLHFFWSGKGRIKQS